MSIKNNKAMNITIELNEAQQKELAKMLYIAEYVVSSSGKNAKGYQYPLLAKHESTLCAVYKAILQSQPKISLVRVDEQSKTKYTHSQDMEEEMQDLMSSFRKDGLIEELCYAISERAYDEYLNEGGEENNEVYDAIYHRNYKWLEEHGVGALVIPG